MRPLGLSGRDLVRVVMGFGCNVPAVISMRACSSCSRGTCISAIAFGAACSYQLGATLGVFAAAGLPYLILPYLLFLSATTLAYVRLTAPREARSPLNLLLSEGRNFLQWPGPSAIWRESRGTRYTKPVLSKSDPDLPRGYPNCFAAGLVESGLELGGGARTAYGVVPPSRRGRTAGGARFGP